MATTPSATEGYIASQRSVFPCNYNMAYHYIPEARKQLDLRMSQRRMTVKEIMNAMGMGWRTYGRLAGCCSRTTRDQIPAS